MGYLTAAKIDAAMTALVKPGLCTKTEFGKATVSQPGEGPTKYSMLTIANGSGPNRPHLLIVAGMHAREWGQPEAVISFLQELLKVYNTPSSDFHIKPYTDLKKHTWSAPDVPHDKIARMIDEMTIHVVPLANPDGRIFSEKTKAAANANWRKNRAPAAAKKDVGVDINRNFDIAWDYEVYFSKAFVDLKPPVLSASKVAADPRFIGNAGAKQPEVENLVELLVKHPITWCIDLHSWSGFVMYPWGIEQDGDKPEQNFRNVPTSFDRKADGTGGRDGTLGTAYKEFIPTGLLHSHDRIAKQMRDSIKAAAGREYEVGPISKVIYPATGSLTDFAFSRQFKVPSSPEFHSFALEFGDAVDNFQPVNDPKHVRYKHAYPRIEREVWAALLSFLEAALPPAAISPAPPPVGGPAPPPPPGSGPGTGGGKLCLLSIALADLAQGAPWLDVLRSTRTALRAGALTARPMAAVERAYLKLSLRFGPVLAKRRWARRAVAYGLAAPAVAIASIALRAARR